MLSVGVFDITENSIIFLLIAHYTYCTQFVPQYKVNISKNRNQILDVWWLLLKAKLLSNNLRIS